MMWAHWLQRLDDPCPGLCSRWLTGYVLMWLQVLVLVQAVRRSWTI